MKLIIRRILPTMMLLFLVNFFASGQPGLVEAAPLSQANLLQNPGFEEPYSGGAAAAWYPWHEEYNTSPKPENCNDRYSVLPSWSAELATPSLILEGGRSQHVGNQWDTWHGGVMQTVNVTPGSTYRLTFWAIGRASNDQFPIPSNTEVNMDVRGGIDPNGSGLWYDGDIVWGIGGSPHDSGNQTNWQQFSAEATASGGQMTILVQANFSGANQCRGHMDVWFDKAELIEVSPPAPPTSPPPPPPPPAPPRPVSTATPVPPPTATPLPPTATPIPSPTPTYTPEPPKTGAICANSFADSNADGLQGADEGFMAGITFTISQNNQIVTQGISTGSSSAVCFENILPGDYVVTQILPQNLIETTQSSAIIPVNPGSTVSTIFGSRILQPGEENVVPAGTVIAESPGTGGPGTGADQAVEIIVPEGSSSGDGDGLGVTAIIGLVAIFMAVALLGALVVILLRQQRG